ncbi:MULTISPECIES: hypothetical protein [unclassified Sphingomonas]|uniref:hypothetical protein n=1 Tax=unclassified Sphingomonas TaxID=196159 RepID=UPI0012E18DC3|nr:MULTISPECIES: hypothetical protein [unclassified Sphingomonas]
MEYVTDDTPLDRLYLRALAIRYEGHRGLWMPIMWHLALRGYPGAMIELADWFSYYASFEGMGTAADAFSAVGLYRRAYVKGDTRAAQNLAVSYFNRGDLNGYRTWLRRAVRAGDTEAKAQLRYFELRLPHRQARKIGRLRPMQKRDDVI